MTYKILDLFSGLGGFSLGLERTGHFKTIAFCDNDKFSKLILDKHWKGIKIYDDVREITKEKFKEDGIPFPDIITGGFPCQPFSVAGKQKGTSDDRHLWPEMFRIIKAFKPRYVIGENVRGIINIQDGVVFETVCTDLESEGYEVQPFIIPAAGVGAPHRRERVWVVAIREDVANTVGNDEGREISRSNEETRGIQEKHRTEHSATRKSSRTSEIRNGDNGYEKRINVADTNDEGVRTRIGGSDNDHETESRSWRADGGRSTSDDERHNSTSTEVEGMDVADTTSSRPPSESIGNIRSMGEKSSQEEEGRNQSSVRTSPRSSERTKTNVANTKSIESNVGGLEQRQRERSGQGEVGGASGSTNVANTNTERLQGAEQFETHTGETKTQFSTTQSSKAAGNYWEFEPNVGRVAHGVSGRVHRLKGLGNSIVPQIAEEIGYALIRAEHEK
jgi:DNA (cytosine-5)-methyltransferase 1